MSQMDCILYEKAQNFVSKTNKTEYADMGNGGQSIVLEEKNPATYCIFVPEVSGTPATHCIRQKQKQIAKITSGILPVIYKLLNFLYHV
jgi:hypothetical protein